jgi:hypothetical protein
MIHANLHLQPRDEQGNQKNCLDVWYDSDTNEFEVMALIQYMERMQDIIDIRPAHVFSDMTDYKNIKGGWRLYPIHKIMTSHDTKGDTAPRVRVEKKDRVR